jgi:hypothetical protein
MKKNILKKASIGIVLGIAFGFTLLPFLALAYFTPAQTGQVPGPIITSPTDISNLVQRILNWVGGIVMTIALIMLLWAAILYLTAGGAEDRVKRAKNYLIYAIIGIVVAILAFSVQPLLETVLRRNF